MIQQIHCLHLRQPLISPNVSLLVQQVLSSTDIANLLGLNPSPILTLNYHPSLTVALASTAPFGVPTCATKIGMSCSFQVAPEAMFP
jgi:hypothetical protein